MSLTQPELQANRLTGQVDLLPDEERVASYPSAESTLPGSPAPATFVGIVKSGVHAFRILVGLLCAQFVCLAAPVAPVVELDITGIVHPVTVELLRSAIEKATAQHSPAIVIRLSTPGGLMDATRQIVEQILHSPVPVIMWTGPAGAQSASAGFFLLESGDIAAMAPGTNTGASHPVLMSGQMDAIMKEKTENDAAALLRTITSRRGRNTAVAEKAVRESVSWTDKEALDLHLIDLIAADPGALLAELEGREFKRFDGSTEQLHVAGALLDLYRPTLRQRILLAIADPNIALLLLVGGALCIYLEFSSPGLVAPGVIGAVLLLLGLTALSMLPIAWLGATLLILGFVFLILEIKLPAHGVLTVGGALCLVLGAVMLVDSPLPELRIRLSVAIALALPFALISAFLFSIAQRARRNKVGTGVEGMVGEEGVAIGEINPSGTVFVHGEYWKATAGAPIAAATRVLVESVDGLNLRVAPAPPSGRQ